MPVLYPKPIANGQFRLFQCIVPMRCTDVSKDAEIFKKMHRKFQCDVQNFQWVVFNVPARKRENSN